MKIRIPDLVLRWYDAFGKWSNVPVHRQGKLEVRRIDIILAFGFLFCVVYYALTSGWQGVIMGGVLYLAVMATALWML